VLVYYLKEAVYTSDGSQKTTIPAFTGRDCC
jgi:hypothetical protein